MELKKQLMRYAELSIILRIHYRDRTAVQSGMISNHTKWNAIPLFIVWLPWCWNVTGITAASTTHESNKCVNRGQVNDVKWQCFIFFRMTWHHISLTQCSIWHIIWKELTQGFLSNGCVVSISPVFHGCMSRTIAICVFIVITLDTIITITHYYTLLSPCQVLLWEGWKTVSLFVLFDYEVLWCIPFFFCIILISTVFSVISTCYALLSPGGPGPFKIGDLPMNLNVRLW